MNGPATIERRRLVSRVPFLVVGISSTITLKNFNAWNAKPRRLGVSRNSSFMVEGGGVWSEKSRWFDRRNRVRLTRDILHPVGVLCIERGTYLRKRRIGSYLRYPEYETPTWIFREQVASRCSEVMTAL